jgi:hypothetical protein
MLSTPNVSKHASIRHGNDPWEKSPGAVSAASGDRIRTCDLWVMSPPFAVSPGAPRLIVPGHGDLAV